jgi:hypothetical protein
MVTPKRADSEDIVQGAMPLTAFLIGFTAMRVPGCSKLSATIARNRPSELMTEWNEQVYQDRFCNSSQSGVPGRRLDVVDGHNVAALVYSRRKHFINLFVWPYREKEFTSDSSGSRQGYNWVNL